MKRASQNISLGLKQYNQAKREKGTVEFPKRLDRVTEPFSRVFINTCKHCGSTAISRIKRKFCDDHVSMYERAERERFAFTFRLEDYPDLFDVKHIREIGMYHTIKNPGGLSRDHRVSVNEAIRNGYDPFYVKHPLNCEIMAQSENASKKTKSSISYDELKRLVNEFEMLL